jgi:hypothetical protein
VRRAATKAARRAATKVDEARRQTAINLLRQTSLDDAAIAAATELDADAVRALRQDSTAG